jgi:hypothetical protein
VRGGATVDPGVLCVCLTRARAADHACALWRKLAHPGWLYLSENYLCFYAYVLGAETKLLVELKDIRLLSKEQVAGLAKSVRIATIDGKEVCRREVQTPPLRVRPDT